MAKHLTKNDILQKIREKNRFEEATKQGFVTALVVSLNILCSEDYWGEDAAKEMAPKFMGEVISLLETIDEGWLTADECLKYIYDVTGYSMSFKK